MATIEQYCTKPAFAGQFVNQILYRACLRDSPLHDDPYVTAGKIIAIGRIYAASPQRGAGKPTNDSGYDLFKALGEKLKLERLDDYLNRDVFNERFSTKNLKEVVALHRQTQAWIYEASEKWSGSKPRHQPSFVSKYLHFHRPNAFPIMDSIATAGLQCARKRKKHGEIGPANTGNWAYEDFCAEFLEFAALSGIPDWTPRSIDTLLLTRGGIHLDRDEPNCVKCGGNKRRHKSVELN